MGFFILEFSVIDPMYKGTIDLRCIPYHARAKKFNHEISRRASSGIPSDPNDPSYWPMVGGVAFDPRKVK